MSRYTYQQERELLEMQAQLARLKIAAEYLQKRRAAEQQSLLDANFSTAVGLANGLPSGHLLWNSVFLPLRWKHRIAAAAALLLWQLWRDGGHSGSR